MTDEENKISNEAIKYIKNNKKDLVSKFTKEVKSSTSPESYFMAGSPGAGKTEYFKRFIDGVKKDTGASIVRIDGDEIREILPQYNGSNSFLFQRAISKGVDILYDYALHNKLTLLLDTTFCGKQALDNVKRSIDKKRKVYIFYLYQDPLNSWKLTKARESKEGRMVPIEVFVDHFFTAKDNVNEAKRIFGDKISICLIKRDCETKSYSFEYNIDKVDNYLKINYTKESLLYDLQKMKI